MDLVEGNAESPSLHPDLQNLFFFFFFFKGLQHMEVPRLGVKSELQLPAYTTATATRDPSHVCDLHRSLWQLGVLNPLRGQGSNLHPHGY